MPGIRRIDKDIWECLQATEIDVGPRAFLWCCYSDLCMYNYIRVVYCIVIIVIIIIIVIVILLPLWEQCVLWSELVSGQLCQSTKHETRLGGAQPAEGHLCRSFHVGRFFGRSWHHSHTVCSCFLMNCCFYCRFNSCFIVIFAGTLRQNWW